jgi:hypothetical protein
MILTTLIGSLCRGLECMEMYLTVLWCKGNFTFTLWKIIISICIKLMFTFWNDGEERTTINDNSLQI